MAATATEVRASTPERILDAAFDAIGDFGLSRATVEDVAHRAGLSRQTVYRYFPSKDHLVVALVSREEEKFIDGVRAVFAARDHLEEAFAEAWIFVLHYARQHPLLDRLLATEQQTFLPYLTTRGLPVITRARDAMVELALELEPTADPRFVRDLLDVTTRAIVSYIITPSDRPPQEVAATVARALVAAIRKEDAP